MKKVYIYYFFIFTTFFLTYCGAKHGNNAKKRLFETDTVVGKFFVPEPRLEFIGTDSQSIIFENAVQLDPIRTGFDSIQIRITYAYSENDPKYDSSKVLIIKRLNSIWSCEVRKFNPVISNDSIYYVVTVQKKKGHPKNGWATLMSNLFSYRLLNTQFKFIEEEGPLVHSPTIILFQVATKGKYQEYRYMIPTAYKGKYWEIEDLTKIIKLLDAEFGFQL